MLFHLAFKQGHLLVVEIINALRVPGLKNDVRDLQFCLLQVNDEGLQTHLDLLDCLLVQVLPLSALQGADDLADNSLGLCQDLRLQLGVVVCHDLNYYRGPTKYWIHSFKYMISMKMAATPTQTCH